MLVAQKRIVNLSSRFFSFLIGCMAMLPPAASAQMFSYNVGQDRPVQSLSVGYTFVDFSFAGEGEPTPSFEFSEPFLSAVYTRPAFVISLGFGTQAPANPSEDNRDLRMLDLSLTTWGALTLLQSEEPGQSRIFLPIAIHSSYRRVAPKGEEDSLLESFNLTVLGLGTGLGYNGKIGKKAVLEARATPIIGLVIRSFGDTRGLSTLFEGDLQFHFGPWVKNLGFSIGYGLKAQSWNISASDLIPSSRDDLFDYNNLQHTFRVGVNW